jgi:SAM-dependent methyltransferase
MVPRARQWLRRWDLQQSGYLPEREDRFRAMFDIVQTLLPVRFRAVDLACGPGSLSQRLLERFPRARVLAVDFDPVLLAIGRAALGTMGGSLSWAEADLRSPDWTRALPERRCDAVLTTTALHWLSPDRLRRLYRTLAGRLRRGGIFLNGDRMGYGAELPTLRRATERVHLARSRARRHTRAESWDEWWDAVEREPRFGPLVRERLRRYGARHADPPETPFPDHERWLRAAGFREVSTVWQRLDDRVLVAIR